MQQLLHELDAATSARELKLRIMDGLGAALGAGATGLYLFGPEGAVDEVHVRGVRDGFVLAYEQLGRDSDPILARALATGAPAHDGEVLGEAWPRSPLYRACASPWKIRHYLCAPVVVDGSAIGTLNLGRSSDAHPFTAEDAARVGAVVDRAGQRLAALTRPDAEDDDGFGRLRAERTRLRMHVDALERDASPIGDAEVDRLWTAFVEGTAAPLDMFDHDERTYVVLLAPAAPRAPRAPLTPREADVVRRAAAGMANKEIAYELGISPSTVGATLVAARRKLGVTSRVKLVEAARSLPNPTTPAPRARRANGPRAS